MTEKQKIVWLFQIGETLPVDTNNRKMRTALLAEKFAEKGWKVVWWASAFDHQKKQWITNDYTVLEWKPEVKIVLLVGCGYSKNLSIKRFYDHRLIVRKFRAKCGDFPTPDLVVASMPTYDLAREAVLYAKKNNIPSVVDIRDMWPDIFLDYLPKLFRPFAKLFLRWDFMMLKECLQKANALTSMMDGVLAWGMNYAQRPVTKYDKVFYLGEGKAEKISLDDGGKIKSLIPQLEGKFVVCFIGTFGYYNNPSILIDVARNLQGQDIVFVIGGDGIFFKEIEEKASGLKNVFLPGWLNKNEIQTLLEYSSIGVVPATTERKAFPNKAFVYFSASIPVISSSHGDLEELIKLHQVGCFYAPNDVSELQKNIMSLASDTERYERMCANSKKLFEKELDAEIIYKNFADHLCELAEKKR